jgi:adenylate cyclase
MGSGPARNGRQGVLATADIFQFEGFRLDRQGDGLSRRNERGAFVPVPIGLRALDVLCVLVKRSGELVSKEEIMAAVWGRTVVENANLTVQISTLRRVLDEGRTDESCIRTVAARGYRFVAPVTRIENENANRDQAKVFASAARPSIADKPSVAVLAFTNMTSSPEREFVADGIAEDIITALSRCPWLLVIGRNSSFAYKGRAFDLKQVGYELGARYVLEGGVQSARERMRITTQLVDTETGAHIWANRYDRDFDDIFAVQDEITESVTIAIAPAVADAEQRRAMRKPTESIDAWTAFQRGIWHLHKFNPGDNARAQTFFQQTIDLDPTFAAAYCGLAWAHTQAATVLQTYSLTEAQNSAEALARRAIALDPAGAEGHSTLGFVLWLRGDSEGAVAEARQALAISPNLAFAHAVLGAALIFSGQPRDGIVAFQTAIRLDPHQSMLPSRLMHMAMGFYFCREYETAAEVAKQAIRLNPDYPLTYRWLAAALGQVGQTAEAKETLAKAIAVAPASFDFYVRNRAPWTRPEDHAHMLEGLRRAGWNG